MPERVEADPTRTETPAPQPDRADAYLPRDRRRAMASGAVLPERVAGAGLFADVSGFTALALAMATELGARRGAEELTARINDVFHGVIELVHRFGGEVIYFSGDAVTCWFDGDDGSVAASAALAIRDAMPSLGRVVTPGGATLSLAIKQTVAVGGARRFVVGIPEIQLIEVLAGRLLDDLADAERVAAPGEVLLAESACAALHGRAELGDTRPVGDGAATLLVALHDAVPVPAHADDPQLDPERARPWLLPDVFERLSTGQGEFLAELRGGYPVFIRFGHIDFETDPDAPGALDRFVRSVQGAFHEHGGNVLQLTLGDKGAYLYGVFGSPRAHEDDAVRAAAAVLQVRDAAASWGITDLQVGMAHGILRSGTYGHERRRTFVCLGDAVNLAARLMAAAPPGRVLASEDVRTAAGSAFEWADAGTIVAKGRSVPTAVAELVGAASRRSVLRYPRPMHGRDGELEAVLDASREAFTGQGRCVRVGGPAGIGKSRLLAEVIRRLRADGVWVAYGAPPAASMGTGYAAWREVGERLLGLWGDAWRASPGPVLAERVGAMGGRPERAPLLGALLGAEVGDSELTRAFDAKLRKQSLESLVADLVVARAADTPTALLFDDAHRLDELSVDLVTAVLRSIARSPVVVILVGRDDHVGGAAVVVPPGTAPTEVVLGELDDDSARAVVSGTVAGLFGPEVAPAASLVEMVVSRGRGNPFYLEELLNTVRDRGLDPTDPAVAGSLDLPDSLHRLVLSRIDTMPESPRRAVKVASAIGTTFRVEELAGALEGLDVEADVPADLDRSRRAQLIVPGFDDAAEWTFRTALIGDVAYESLPYERRAAVHAAIGRWHESRGPDHVELHLDDLAFHWLRTDDAPRAVGYLERAAEAAERRYANAAAAEYWSQLAQRTDGLARAEVLLRRARVLERAGDWEDAGRDIAESLAVAAAQGGRTVEARALVASAEIARRQGRYADASASLHEASARFEAEGDDAGRAQVLHLQGTLAAQQGEFGAATEAYRASMVLRERLDDRAGLAALWSNLGVVAEYEGDLEASLEHHGRALALRTELDDRWAISVSHTNIGMSEVRRLRFEEAERHFERAMLLSREVGDRWMIAISHHNLANARRGRGRIAEALGDAEAALVTFRDYDDRWAMAFLAEDVAQLAAAAGDRDTAWWLVGVADAARAALGSPRPESLEQELAVSLVAPELELPQLRARRADGAAHSVDRMGDAIMNAVRTIGARFQPRA